MQKDRDLSFDAFRGVAIIAVVAIHTNSSVGYDDFPCLFYRQLLNFAIPAFIFMSGYWSSKRPIKSLRDYKDFLTRRLSRVLLPYFFWSFVILGYTAIQTHDINAYEIALKLAVGGACVGYYFVIAISQLYILTPLLQYINCKPYGLILVLILNIISLLVVYLSRLFNLIWHVPVSLAFYSWVIFYQIGLWVGSRDDMAFAPKKKMHLLIPLAILACWLLSDLEVMIVSTKYNNVPFAAYAVKYSSFLYSACVIFGFLLEKRLFARPPRWLVLTGRYSFGIYLTHVIILNPVSNIFQRTDVIHSFRPLCQFVIVLITLSICFALIAAARKLLPESFCSKVLGF